MLAERSTSKSTCDDEKKRPRDEIRPSSREHRVSSDEKQRARSLSREKKRQGTDYDSQRKKEERADRNRM